MFLIRKMCVLRILSNKQTIPILYLLYTVNHFGVQSL